MSKFLSEKLGVAAEIIPGFAFKSEEFGKTGTKAVKIKDINPPIINAAEADRVNVSNYSRERLKKYEIHEGDFVVAMTGATVGKIGKHVSKEVLYTNQRVAKIVPRSGFYKEFVYYAIQGGDFLKFILNRLDSSSAQGNISGTSIGEYPIPCPDFQTQRGVAAVLSALDSKIELNNRINAELEGMAKLLYDYWFVQFDFPMTAAQAAALGKPHLTGHPYRASGGKMIYNGTLKRDIPEGWTDGRLLDVATFTNGIACQKYPANGGETLRVIKIKEMRTGLTSDSDIVTANVPSKVKIKNGDILFSWSASLEVMIWAGGEGALNQHIFKVTSDTHPRSFCYFVLLDYLRHFRMIADLRKTTMGHITIDHLEQSQIAIPDDEVARAFEMITKPIIDRMVKSHEENQELTQLRDWLLPMLMNGQVTVGTTEH